MTDHLPSRVDLMPLPMRKPKAGPLLSEAEAVACGLNYAMQFEFWKREINPDSQVVQAVLQSLRLEGYEITVKAATK